MLEGLALAITVILLFALGYCTMVAPAFLLVRLDEPPVSRLLRGVFHYSFVMVAGAAGAGAVVFALAGRPAFVIWLGALAAAAFLGRRWFMQRFDAHVAARDAGDAVAVRRLRKLHWAGMACSIVPLAAVIASIPYVSPN